MKVVQKDKHPRSFFLVAETEEDKIVIQALRISGNHAVEIRTIFDDDVYDELVRDPATLNAMVLHQSGKGECDRCFVDQAKHIVKICPEHQAQWEEAFLRETVEVEFKVPCICAGLEPYMSSYDPETGHQKNCLVPAIEKVKGRVPSQEESEEA